MHAFHELASSAFNMKVAALYVIANAGSVKHEGASEYVRTFTDMLDGIISGRHRIANNPDRNTPEQKLRILAEGLHHIEQLKQVDVSLSKDQPLLRELLATGQTLSEQYPHLVDTRGPTPAMLEQYPHLITRMRNG